MKSFKEHLMEGVASPALASNNLLMSYERNKDRMSDEERRAAVTQIYDKMLPFFEQVKGRLQNLIRSSIGAKPGSGNPPKILIGIKPLKSAFSKIIARGKRAHEINDFVRCAILFDNPDQVKFFLKDFRRKNHNIVSEYEEKTKGGDKAFGYYGSHHLTVMIDGLGCEMQVMTKKLWQFKDEAHNIYDKYRDKGGQPSKFDQYTSKKIFSLGNRPKFTPEELENHDTDGLVEWVLTYDTKDGTNLSE